jgi:putative oxidoreductase
MLDRTTVYRNSRSLSASVMSWGDVAAERWWDSVLLLARILMAAIFIPSGFSKLMGLDGFAAQLLAQGVPLARVVAPVAASVEFVGGLAILLGMAGRYAALLMALFTLCAALTAHRYWAAAPDAARNQHIHFMKNIAMVGGFLALFVVGPGRWSFDRLLAREADPAAGRHAPIRSSFRRAS